MADTVADGVADGMPDDMPDQVTDDVGTVRARVATTARRIAAAGLVEAFGHVSARLADGGMAITSTRPLHAATAGDVLVLDSAGAVVAGPAHDVPLETWLHAAVYAARPDVGGICRGHPPYAVVWGTTTRSLPALHGLGLLAGRHVRVHDDVELVSTPARGAAVAASLGKDQALLLRGNGALAVGADLAEAAARLAALEDRARVAVLAAAAGLGTAPRTSWAARSRDSSAEMRRAARWFAHRYGTAASHRTRPTTEEEPCSTP